MNPPERAGCPELIVVGSSTGGPAALKALLAVLPADFPVPIVVAQHMPEEFTPLLAANLDDQLAVRVRQAADGDKPEPGLVLVAPGNLHLLVAPSGRVEVRNSAPIKSVRPSADLLFRSAAVRHGPRVVAVVLTGMGSDGVDGARDIVLAGGAVLAQDEASSVVWGMPGAVVNAGLADIVGPPDRLGFELLNRSRWT